MTGQPATFNWAKEAWERLSREELDETETSTDNKFVDYVNNVINDIKSDSMPKAELVRGMFVALIMYAAGAEI